MKYDTERATKKRAELLATVQNALPQVGDDESKNLIEQVCAHSLKITPPEEQEFTFQLIVLNRGGLDGGRSTKAGNVRLNLMKLIHAVANGTLTTTALIEFPLLAPLVGLILWKDLKSCVEVELTEREASVIWTMWLKTNESHTIAAEGLLDLVNEQRAKYRLAALSENELKITLSNLEKMKCIKPSQEDKARWWLCEWVADSFN